jgi:hypothetical protein
MVRDYHSVNLTIIDEGANDITFLIKEKYYLENGQPYCKLFQLNLVEPYFYDVSLLPVYFNINLIRLVGYH